MGVLINNFVVDEINVSKKPYYFIDVFFTKELIDDLGCNVETKNLDEEMFIKLYNHFVTGEESLFISGFNFKSFSTHISPDIKLKLFRTHTIGLVKERISSKEELKENFSIEKVVVRFDEDSYNKAERLKEIEINEAVENLKFALHEHYDLDDNKHNLEIAQKAFELVKMAMKQSENNNFFMSSGFIDMVEKFYIKLKDLEVKNNTL